MADSPDYSSARLTLTPPAIVANASSVICASSYGGTGAGIVPLLVRRLCQEGHLVSVVLLNRWIVSEAKERIIDSNEHASLQTMRRLKNEWPDQVSYFFLRVDRDRTPPPKEMNNNTLMEIANPFPYYASKIAANLLGLAPGMTPKSGVYKVAIDKIRMWQNGAFQSFYAYARLRAKAARELPEGFDAVLDLMDGEWGLRNLRWNPNVLKDVQALEFGTADDKEKARSNITKRLQEGKASAALNGPKQFSWPGFAVTEDEGLNSREEILPTSYPTAFTSYYWLKANLGRHSEHRDAYLALLALVATKRVYAEYDPALERWGCRTEPGIAPFVLRDDNRIWGFVGEKGIYVWPALCNVSDLKEMLEADGDLRQVLLQARQDPNRPWDGGSIVARAIDSWARTTPSGAGDRRWYSLQFFKEVIPANRAVAHSTLSATPVFDREATEIKLAVEGEGFDIELNGQDHQILALPEQRKILQWTNTILGAKNRRSDKKARRKEPDKDKLILNYATVVSVPGWEVEILHPSYVLYDRTYEFAVTQPGEVGSRIPWPVRKDYLECLEGELRFTEPDGSVRWPATTKGAVDVTPCTILNWGTVATVDPRKEARALFEVPIALSLEPGVCEYQGYVWPCDPYQDRFVQEWKFYSVLVTSEPTNVTLRVHVAERDHQDAKAYQEHWYCRRDGSWQQLEAERRNAHLAVWSGSPPSGIAFELEGPQGCDGGWFPLPGTRAAPACTDLTVGLDFGSHNTCSAAVLPQMGDVLGATAAVSLNPSDLLYPVFSNRNWSDTQLGFAWVPYFNPAAAGGEGNRIIPTGVWSSRYNEKHDGTRWSAVTVASGLGDTINFADDDKKERQQPLAHYSIPGDNLYSAQRNLPEAVYELKWQGTGDRRLIYLKDFLTTYFLFLAAHFFFVGENRSFSNNLSMNATVPLSYTSIDGKFLSTWEEEYWSVFAAAADDATEKTGVTLARGSLSYEAVCSLPATPRPDELSIVVDVGGGTTDIAIMNGSTCISASSFIFAGRNPFGQEYGKDYIQQILALRSGAPAGREQLIQEFINVLCAYTALLAGAAICQTGNSNAKLYPIGQGWYLADYLPGVGGRTEAVVAQRIVEMFNKYVLPALPNGVERPELTTSDVYLSPNAAAAKLQCSLGAINANRVEAPQRSRLTFLGITCAPGGKITTDPWWTAGHDSNVRVASVKDFDLQTPSPSLILDSEALGRCLSSTWKSLEAAKVVHSGILTKNMVEHLLSNEVGKPSGNGAPVGQQSELLSATMKNVAPAPQFTAS